MSANSSFFISYSVHLGVCIMSVNPNSHPVYDIGAIVTSISWIGLLRLREAVFLVVPQE